jgi:hypothetical protein
MGSCCTDAWGQVVACKTDCEKTVTKKKNTPQHVSRPSDAVSTKVKNILNIKGEFERRTRLPNEAMPDKIDRMKLPVYVPSRDNR